VSRLEWALGFAARLMPRTGPGSEYSLMSTSSSGVAARAGKPGKGQARGSARRWSRKPVWFEPMWIA
jgi:hypothetical protein